MSLIQRLEMTRQLALLAQDQAGGAPPHAITAQRTLRPGAQAIVLAWFSLGVLMSGALGVGSLFGLKALQAQGTPLTWEALATTMRGGVEATVAAAWSRMPTMPLLTPPSVSPPTKQPAVPPKWDVVRMPIERGTRHASLGVQVTGTADLPVELVLDGVPAGVRPSHGSAIGATTWVLGQADLDDLSLMLDDTAPDAFDLKIAVVAPRNVATIGSVVQVRLVESGESQAHAAAEPAQQAVAETEAPPAAAAPGSPRDADNVALRKDEAGAPSVAPSGPRRTAASAASAAKAVPAETSAEAASAAPAASRTWPEGAYGLGAVSREPETPLPSGPPAWSPFGNGAQ
ncbi:MAG TPA: hypothetical protein VFZ16_00080 [Hyphomicrobiaceae bacterium]|nr:hypothetical protein [Hyphomicrobiaceae bacterium]